MEAAILSGMIVGIFGAQETRHTSILRTLVYASIPGLGSPIARYLLGTMLPPLLEVLYFLFVFLAVFLGLLAFHRLALGDEPLRARLQRSKSNK